MKGGSFVASGNFFDGNYPSALKIFDKCPIYRLRSLKMSHMEVIKVAIEPLGSIMTMQAQPLQPRTVQRTEQVSTEANPTETQVNNIDPTTVSVAAATDTPENNSENTGGGKREENSFNYADTAKQQNDKIKKAVEQLNKNLSHSSAIFGIHEATNRVTIKIVDKDTKEVIKELPPEKTLDMIAKVWELAGILVDEKR